VWGISWISEDISKLKSKSSLMLLMEIVSADDTDICDDVLTLAASYGRTDTESLRQCYYTLSKRSTNLEPLKLSVQTPSLNYSPNLSSYDSLTGGELHV